MNEVTPTSTIPNSVLLDTIDALHALENRLLGCEFWFCGAENCEAPNSAVHASLAAIRGDLTAVKEGLMTAVREARA